jgi:hypothetical protein
MADRIVSVKLRADISSYVSSLQKAAASTKGFGTDVERSMQRNLEPAMTRAGERSGGVLAQGINSGLIRNSPLIAAAVGGALAAGAPVAIAGAAMLFGGIGAVAAAQSLEVRRAWLELGDEITSGTIEDARILIPELTKMAGDLGDSFQDLRPQLRDAFEATAPLVETFADGVAGLATNSMPGFVKAIQSADPVMEGFQSFLESTGTGLSDFFGGLADNAPAAGESFDALGDIVGELLPLIGEFLGQGAELASVVLPPVAEVLGSVTDVAERLGPLLPAIVAGFTGMKIAQSLGGNVGVLVGNLDNFAAKGGLAAGAAGRISSGLSAVSASLPIVGAAVGLVAAGFEQAEQKGRDWALALREGGDAGDVARAEMAALREEVGNQTSWWQIAAGAITGGNVALSENVRALDAAETANRDYVESLSPLELAQLRVDQAQEGVNDAVGRFGAESPQAAAALDAYEQASARAEREQAELQLAVDGVTQAMVDQANQAMAAIDSSFAYRNSTNQLEDAQIALKDAVVNLTAEDETLRTTQEDVERAQLLVEEQSYRTALAFGQQQADLSGLEEGTSQYARVIQEQALAKLYELRDAAGPEMKGAIQTQIDALLLSGVHLDETGAKTDAAAGKADGFRDSVNGIPAYKQTVIDADTGPATAEIDTLMARLRSEGALTISRAATAQNIHRRLGGAIGGIVHAYADGGFEPMRGGIAQVVAPNTWRVIGDRVVDDEAYIPINKSQRSQTILKQTASRMGYQLAPSDMRYFADGGIADRYMLPLGLTSGQRANLEQVLSAPGGGGSLVGGGTMVTQLLNTIRSAFPRAKMNSGYRAGDPGYHGLARAVDLGESGFAGGSGRPYLGDMAAHIYRNYGAQTKELIYTGAYDRTPDIRNGAVHNFGASTNAAHRNHVHWAMANGGVIGEPVVGMGMWSGGSYSFGERGPETVTPGIRSREFTSGSGAASGGWNGQLPAIDVQARVFVGDREITDIVRVEANTVVDSAFTSLADRMLYNS